jgi:hypothetical protein
MLPWKMVGKKDSPHPGKIYPHQEEMGGSRLNPCQQAAAA